MTVDPAMPETSNAEADAALLKARIFWAAMVGSVLIVGIVCGTVSLDGRPDDAVGGSVDRELFGHPQLWGSMSVAAVCAVAAGFAFRNSLFKKHWVGPVVTPRGFVIASTVGMALAEGVAAASLVFGIAYDRFVAMLVPAAIAWAGLLAMWPTGGVMYARRACEPPAQP
jgi:hypothetical protein